MSEIDEILQSYRTHVDKITAERDEARRQVAQLWAQLSAASKDEVETHAETSRLRGGLRAAQASRVPPWALQKVKRDE